MKEQWLSKELILAVHAAQIAEHGGLAGLRDEGLLESALARPRNLAAYGAPDMFDLAAAYAFGIASNHPFLDGNKRVAFVASATFLRLHGFSLTAAMEERVATFLRLAAGEIDEPTLAAWLRTNSVRRIGKSRK